MGVSSNEVNKDHKERKTTRVKSTPHLLDADDV